MLFSLTLAIP